MSPFTTSPTTGKIKAMKIFGITKAEFVSFINEQTKSCKYGVKSGGKPPLKQILEMKNKIQLKSNQDFKSQ